MELYAEALEACLGDSVVIEWSIDFLQPGPDEVLVDGNPQDILSDIEDDLRDE